MDTPQRWTKDDFMKWRRNEYSIWKNSLAATAASGNTVTNTTAAGTKPAVGDDRTKLNDFNKTAKSEKDYEILKNEEYFYGWKKKFERKAQVHKYKRLLTTTYKDTESHRLTLAKDSYDLELFEEQVNFMSIIMEFSLRTVKGKDLIRMYPADPIQLWKKLLFHHKGSDASTDAASKLLQRLTDIRISNFPLKTLFRPTRICYYY